MVKIDLHGLKHSDIEWFLIKKIEKNWGNNIEIEIITGYSEKMKEIVIKILNEYKLDYQIGDFLGFNKGYIKITV